MDIAAPIDAGIAQVKPEWIDYNGHMNLAYYVLAFDQAVDRIFEVWDLSGGYVTKHAKSFFVLETHVTYQGEVKEGDPLRFEFQILDIDAKRVHFFMTMYHAVEGFVAATSEQIMLHVDMGTRRSEAMPAWVMDILEPVARAHASLPRPREAGRNIGIRRTEKAPA